MKKRAIVFIHGLWLHASSWQAWMDFFSQHGYIVLNPAWPGDGMTVEDSRRNRQTIGNHGMKEVADSYAAIIEGLNEPPVLIGHSFGGLIAQILLARGIAAAGIAIDPAPMKGIWQLPFSALRSSWPVLRNPFNLKKAVCLTFDQFHYAFGNAIPEDEARILYRRWTIPAPAKPLFQAAAASLLGSETKVNTRNAVRGPLLVTGGERDHIVPALLSRAAVKKYNPGVVTDYKQFGGRGHSLTIDHGWPELADYCLKWLNKNGL
jgi:pimeloyl-ACP methyl ester carboxylesterase